MKKEYRLLDSSDFKKVLDEKRFFSNQSFTLYYSKNELSKIQIGISVSRKLGGAVKRNLIKRQVRMMCESIFPNDLAYSIVLLIRKGYLSKSFEENKNELQFLFQKLSKTR